MKTISLTVIIAAFNEQLNIKDCIKSAQLLSNNIILIDTGSNDKTVTLANEIGVHVLNFPFSKYVEPSREFGINQAQTDWVFILDADERITPKLADEIKKIMSDDKYTYYKVPRKEIFGKKKWLKHGGWWPNYQIRLINKNYFKQWPKEIHSTPVIDGNLGYLKEPLTHFSKNDYEEIVKKTIVFENIESDLLYKASRKVSVLIFFKKLLGETYRRLLKNRGFLDGSIGIIESIYQAYSKTITYLFLYEKKKRGSL
ncbi:MAG: glycosyltransferase family 2 protein [Candidatus Roizmanbacteria bacterium]|nr:MAG: glycosyltransferase family 2 protein [Candidatus Roizmanbacteria bacterium]